MYILEMPKVIENTDEATVGAWSVKEGDDVKSGDLLVEVITDKTSLEIQAPVSGRILKIYAASNSTVPRGYALCAIGGADEIAPDMTSSNEAKLVAFRQSVSGGIDISALMPTKAAAEAPAAPSYRVAPAARAFARQQSVDLAKVAAFCGRDMIHRKDVEDYLNAQKPAEPTVEIPAPLPCGGAMPEAEKNDGGARVALITGASGGIGAAVARALAAQGVTVALHGNATSPDALSDELTAAGKKAAAFTADLAGDAMACQKLVDAVSARFGRIDILVNCAGILADAPVSFMSDEQWNAVQNICLTVPFRMIRACAMQMARRRWGRIITISSDAGRMGAANRSNYAAAKEGLCGLTRSVAQELATMGIRVNAVSPGFIETRMTADLPERRRQELLKSIPVHRFGQPEEVASLVAYLASDQADYITGQVISINGGLCM